MIDGVILMALGALLSLTGIAPFKPALARRHLGSQGFAPPIGTSFPIAGGEPTLEHLAIAADIALAEDAARRARGRSRH